MNIVIGTIVPLLGTALGAGMIFLFRGEMSQKVKSCSLGFASGVMVAASFWSLLLPSIELTEANDSNLPKWLPTSIGFICGIMFLVLLDYLIPHFNHDEDGENSKPSISKSTKLLLAVALHNIPVGMTVGAVFSGANLDGTNISLPAAFILSCGIAIHNIPEGTILAMPLVATGVKKKNAFLLATLTGVIGPIASLITIVLTSQIMAILPYILSFAAGAMIYVVFEELIPETAESDNGRIGTIFATLGFTLMMILDSIFG